MSMPAGWYDDGSGRQRWWDGARWTEHLAPGDATVAPTGQVTPHHMTGYESAEIGHPESATRVAPVLGFVGLGLAVVGTVLACIPLTFVIGLIALVAGFVVSLIGVFARNAAKWPSIVGMILSIVGGVVGTVVTLVIVAATLAGPGGSAGPADPAPSAPTTQPAPSSPSAGAGGDRPAPEEIALQVEQTFQSEGITNYDDMPDFYPCIGEELYASDISDETLQLVITGEDPPEDERDAAAQAIEDAIFACDPEGEGAWG